MIKTFVTFDMLFESQKELKEELQENYLDMKNTMTDSLLQELEITAPDALEKYIERLKRTVK